MYFGALVKLFPGGNDSGQDVLGVHELHGNPRFVQTNIKHDDFTI